MPQPQISCNADGKIFLGEGVEMPQGYVPPELILFSNYCLGAIQHALFRCMNNQDAMNRALPMAKNSPPAIPEPRTGQIEFNRRVLAQAEDAAICRWNA